MSATALPLIHVFSEVDWAQSSVLHLFSPTQISTFLECPRKWAFRRIEKIYEPPNASAALGTESHGLLEKYLGEGVRPDHVAHPVAAKVVSAGLHLLPEPKTPGMLLERDFRFRSERTGFVYGGLKDVDIAPGVPVPTLSADGSAPIVIDHKTTSSIESYAKRPEDLLYDAQATIYAVDSLVRFDANAADLRWVYYQTKGANRSWVSAQRIERPHAARVFDAIEDTAEEMAAALDLGAKPLDLPPNPSACSGFGGCPHRHRCNLSPSQKAKSYMASSLISDLRKRMQGNATPAPSPEPPAPAPSAASVMGCADTDVPPVTEVPKALEQPFTKPAESAINPPEASLAPPPVEAKAEEPPPKKRGRPKKDPVAADAHAATEVVDSKPSAPSETTEVVASNGAEKAEANGTTEFVVDLTFRRGFTLYVDCMPIGREAKVLSTFFEKANQAIEAVHQVPDYRLVDYGKGAPLFAASVLEQVVESGKDVILDTRTPEGAIVLEALASKAAFVVRGLR